MSSSSLKKFHIGSILPIYKEDAELFFQIVEAVGELGFSLSVIAEGDVNIQKRLFECIKRYPQNLNVLENIEQNKKKILNHCDVVIFLTKPNTLDIQEVIRKGMVPILAEDKIFHNFDAQAETGNAFTFREKNIWTILSAIIRASENFKFSYDWNNLRKRLEKTSL